MAVESRFSRVEQLLGALQIEIQTVTRAQRAVDDRLGQIDTKLQALIDLLTPKKEG